MAIVLVIASLPGQFGVNQRAHAAAGEPYIGEIQLFPYQGAPKNWAYLSGQILPINQNTALFSLLGIQFGGNGSTTFAVPNLVGKAPAGMGYYMAIQGMYPSRDGSGYGVGNAALGEVRLFPYTFAPSGWLSLQGQTLPISYYSELYDMLGTTFGGDGNSTFKLPTLTDPAPNIHYAISIDPSVSATNGTGSEFMGEIIPYPVPISNSPFIPAKGALLSINNYEALFQLVDTKFGGNGMTTFAVPDLRGNPAHLEYYIVEDQSIYPEITSTPPSVHSDDYTTLQNNALSVSAPGVLGNDSNAIAAGVQKQTAHGTVVMNSNGSFVYTPIRGYVGNDSFVYEAGNTNSGRLETVNITVEQGYPPVISGVTSNAIYNTAVTPTFNEGTAVLNGMTFTSGTKVDIDGTYTLVVTNTIDSTTVPFTIDQTAPIVTGVTDNGTYSTAPTITFNEGTAMLDNAAIPNGKIVSQEGQHTLVVTDTAGNTTTIGFKVYFKRTLTFNSDGGSAVVNTQVDYNTLATPPAPPVKTGYTFGGWYSDAGHTMPFDWLNTSITTDHTLYAKWVVNPYTVQFNTYGGSAVNDQVTDYNTYITEPPAPTQTGYTFAGWYSDAAYTTLFNFQTMTIMDNLTLYAKWVAKPYTVQFDTDGGSTIANQTVDYSTFINPPIVPTKTGYTFGGWYSDAGRTMPFDFSATSMIADLTLYAKWNPLTYNLTFISNGGSLVNNVVADYNSLALPPISPTRAGYTFMGWYSDPTLTTLFDFSTSLIQSDHILYAKWSNVVYTIQFDTAGGSAIADQLVAYGDILTAPVAPTRTGYSFVGWYSDPALSTPYNWSTSSITEHTILYAKWSTNAYSVRFDTYGGSAVADVNVDYGDKLIAPPAPSKAGYSFVGWYTDNTFTTLFDFNNTPITSNLKLYANWSNQVYTVSFNTYGGSSIDNVFVVNGGKITAPTPPTRSGYTFVHWYLENNLNNVFKFDTTTITSNLTLNANWKKKDDSSSSNNSSSGSTLPDKATSTNGVLILDPTQEGEVSLENDVDVRIPVGAINQPLNVSINKITNTANLLTNQKNLISSIYEINKNFVQNFNIPITLIFTFEMPKLQPNQQAEVFYFDENNQTWISTGAATVKGNRITTQVDHFTKFAVFAVDKPSVSTDPSAEIPATPTPAPLSTVITDIQGHWAESMIQQAVSEGWVKGYVDGSFKPNASVTRAEFIVMMMNLLPTDQTEATLTFKDQASIGAWARSSVAEAVQAGFIQGDAKGTFRPNAQVTRAEMAVIVAKVLHLDLSQQVTSSFADQAKIPAWAKASVTAMQQSRLLSGKANHTFAAMDSTNRAEAIKVLTGMRQNIKK